jgi:hypothetical protein
MIFILIGIFLHYLFFLYIVLIFIAIIILYLVNILVFFTKNNIVGTYIILTYFEYI